MEKFQELIKNFDRIRNYMRQFFVYGFKSRGDYGEKSARTYDNERRRIESWLSGYIQSGYSQKEKHVYISVDSKTIPQNPLYAAWKSKSFTDNDILLHFFLLDILWGQGEGMAAKELCDKIAQTYGTIFDLQTLRLKLKEYKELELFEERQRGRSLCYRLLPGTGALPGDAWQRMLSAISFFQEAAPFGFIGSTILDGADRENRWFQFKHHFIVHTLEDGILIQILTAMNEHRGIWFENKSSRSGLTSRICGIPLSIQVSTQTGRRYVCLYLEDRRRFSNFRLDAITKVFLKEPYADYEDKRQKLMANRPKCWGVSFGGSSRIEELCLTLRIRQETEGYILNRLAREGRGGKIFAVRPGQYLYKGTFFDTNEMLSWVKTFTGRVLDIQGTNPFAIAKVTWDWDKLYEMYCLPRDGQETAMSEATESNAARNAAKRILPAPLTPKPKAPEPKNSPLNRPELFDKIYGVYYQAVRRILAEAFKAPIDRNRIDELSVKYGYSESGLVIVQKLTSGEWPLLTDKAPRSLPPNTPGHFRPNLISQEALMPGSLPLTKLQKSWLKALLADERIALFLTDGQIDAIKSWLSPAKPLYRQEDFHYFDQYLDGDDFSSPAYRENFHTILKALETKKALILAYENRFGETAVLEAAPYQLQYSAKDNKFRLCCLKYSGHTFRHNTILNVGRIHGCHLSRKDAPINLHTYAFRPICRCESPVVMEISGERNSLERCMLHFANYEKHTSFQEETNTWICSIYYDLADEPELLIGILSFGPVIRILGPESFLRQIRERVGRQHRLLCQRQNPQPSQSQSG